MLVGLEKLAKLAPDVKDADPLQWLSTQLNSNTVELAGFRDFWNRLCKKIETPLRRQIDNFMVTEGCSLQQQLAIHLTAYEKWINRENFVEKEEQPWYRLRIIQAICPLAVTNRIGPVLEHWAVAASKAMLNICMNRWKRQVNRQAKGLSQALVGVDDAVSGEFCNLSLLLQLADLYQSSTSFVPCFHTSPVV